jgi:hypothetical protein
MPLNSIFFYCVYGVIAEAGLPLFYPLFMLYFCSCIDDGVDKSTARVSCCTDATWGGGWLETNVSKTGANGYIAITA